MREHQHLRTRDPSSAKVPSTTSGRSKASLGRHLSAVRRALVNGTITPGGSPVNVTTSTPGDTVQLTFTGSAGQRVFALFSNNTINPNCCNQARAYILKPDSTNLSLGTQTDQSPYGGVLFYNRCPPGVSLLFGGKPNLGAG
jgi:hypothetical protein